ncbi:GDNF family receptor alpha-4, partial [Nannospalax galili]|uniref:GDNF family receptor alpha-4 n=1 Tax=Nannospalax galili TaxID=1026970 RepID=UPI00111C4047
VGGVNRAHGAHGGLQPGRPSPGSASSAGGNRCVAAAEACTADAQCRQLRTEYVARCLVGAAPGDCVRSRCRRALRRFFARGPAALTHPLLFCSCADPACAERRRQTFVPACAFASPGRAPPSCLAPLERCERSPLCRPRARRRRAPGTAALRTAAASACTPTPAS